MSFKKTTVEIDGLLRLRTTLKKAGGDVTQLKQANREAANSIVPIAAALAPVGNTGNLKASIRSGATQKAGILRMGKKAVPYAGPIHWGWPKRNIKPNTFAADAAINNQHIWQQAYFDAVEDAIRQVQGK